MDATANLSGGSEATVATLHKVWCGRNKGKTSRLAKLRRKNKRLCTEISQLRTLCLCLLEQMLSAGMIAPHHGLPASLLESKLTPREQQVLGYFVRHPNDKLIANRLGTKPQTVRNQLASIQRKLGIESREQLLAVSYLHMKPEHFGSISTEA